MKNLTPKYLADVLERYKRINNLDDNMQKVANDATKKQTLQEVCTPIDFVSFDRHYPCVYDVFGNQGQLAISWLLHKARTGKVKPDAWERVINTRVTIVDIQPETAAKALYVFGTCVRIYCGDSWAWLASHGTDMQQEKPHKPEDCGLYLPTETGEPWQKYSLPEDLDLTDYEAVLTFVKDTIKKHNMKGDMSNE